MGLNDDLSPGAAEVREGGFLGKDFFTFRAGNDKAVFARPGRDNGSILIFPDSAFEGDFFPGAVDAPVSKDKSSAVFNVLAGLCLPDTFRGQIPLRLDGNKGDIIGSSGHEKGNLIMVHQLLYRIKRSGLPEVQACQFSISKGEDAVRVGLTQGKDLHIFGKGQNLGPGHRRAGFKRGDPQQQTLVSQFIGQTQIRETEKLRGPGRLVVSLRIKEPDQQGRTGFFIRPVGQRQRKGLGLIFLNLGGEKLLVFPGRGKKNRHVAPLKGPHSINPCPGAHPGRL